MAVQPHSPFGEAIRGEFFLDPDLTYLNHGSYGVVPRKVMETRKRLLEECERHPDTWHRQTNAQYWRSSLQAVCDFLGCRPADAVFVENVTTGFDSIVKSFPLEAGDVVMINSLNYGAMRNATLDQCAKIKGIKLLDFDVRLPFKSKEDLVGQFRDFVEKHPNIKLAVVDHITSGTAIKMPVEELIELFHSKGIVVIVDGAHAPGQIPLNIQTLAPDFYICNLHKWLFTPRGAAILWVNPKQSHTPRPAVTSHFHGVNLHKDFCVRGTRDDTTYHCAPSGIQFIKDIGGMTAVREYIMVLLDEASDHLAEVWGTEKYPLPKDMEAPFMRRIRVPELKAYPTTPDGGGQVDVDVKAMFGVQTICLHDNGALWVRISGNVYNCMEDYRKLGRAILALQKRTDEVTDIKPRYWDLEPLNFER